MIKKEPQPIFKNELNPGKKYFLHGWIEVVKKTDPIETSNVRGDEKQFEYLGCSNGYLVFRSVTKKTVDEELIYLLEEDHTYNVIYKHCPVAYEKEQKRQAIKKFYGKQ